MADGDEYAFDVHVPGLAIACVAQAHAGDAAVVAEHLVEHVIPGDADVLACRLFSMS